MEKLDILRNRLKKIGIEINFSANIPWIYIEYINGKRVTETFQANHGFTISFLPIKKDQKMEFTDISEIFKLIRKYNK